MNRRLSVLAAVAIVLAAAAPASAKGLYAGVGLGSAFYSSEVEVDDIANEFQAIDENSTAWKIFGGFSGSGILGVEGGYRDFGTASADVAGGYVESGISGWDVEALGRVKVSVVDIFAKAGVMFWESEGSHAGVSTSDSGTDILWGLGAGMRLGPIGVRLEWESLTLGSPEDLSVVSLGATLGF